MRRNKGDQCFYIFQNQKVHWYCFTGLMRAMKPA